MIAAKIQNVDTTGTKRPLEDVQSAIGIPEAKKLAVSDDKGIVQQLATMQAQRSAGGIANAITVEEWKVPDKMVGLIIRRVGEQITRLQAESGCKVQMAADSGGLPERICTLTGTRQSIEKAKELITSIINRDGPPLPAVDSNHVPDRHSIVEMMIPGPKVDLVIEKGGETIRNLQDLHNTRSITSQQKESVTVRQEDTPLTPVATPKPESPAPVPSPALSEREELRRREQEKRRREARESHFDMFRQSDIMAAFEESL